jgi:hypothetical protein
VRSPISWGDFIAVVGVSPGRARLQMGDCWYDLPASVVARIDDGPGTRPYSFELGEPIAEATIGREHE